MEPFRLLLRDEHPIDHGASRPLSTEVDEPFDRGRIALEHRFDRPVAVVAHPSCGARGEGASAQCVAEEHTLDVPVDDHAPSDHRGE